MERWRLDTYVFLNGNSRLSRILQLSLVLLILLNISVYVAVEMRDVAGRSPARARVSSLTRIGRGLYLFLCANRFVLSTEAEVATPNRRMFDQIEIFSVVVFTIEYSLRLWTIVESGQKSYQPAIMGRLRYAVSLTALIDFVSIATFYLGLMINTKLPGLTWIRALRIFRILKTEAYTNAFQSLVSVIALNQEILGVGLAVAAVLLLLTSTFLYYVEKDDDPEQFGSIPKCMYASMLMLTGQGPPNPPVGGDFPIVTKVAISLTAFFSVAIFAIPAAMLAYGFEVEADKVRRWKLTNQKLKEKCARDGKPYIPLPIEKFAGFDSDLDDSDIDEPAPASLRPVPIAGTAAASGAGPAGAAAGGTTIVTTGGGGANGASTGAKGYVLGALRRVCGFPSSCMLMCCFACVVLCCVVMQRISAESVTVSVNPVGAGLCLNCPHCAKQITVNLSAS